MERIEFESRSVQVIEYLTVYQFISTENFSAVCDHALPFLSPDTSNMNCFHVSCFDIVIHLCSYVSMLSAFSFHDYFRMVAH